MDEGERLRHLAELALVEAPVDPLMEELCGLACRLLDIPTAFVNILDSAQAHVKAHRGHAYVRLPRDIAFCDVAIRSDAPLVVPDLAEDARFAASPLVTAAPHLRFYAGIPLSVAPGVHVGTLCAIDKAPRVLTEEQISCLQTLAALVVGQIRHHAGRQALARQAIELARKQKMLAQTARLAGVGGFEIDPDSGALTASDELGRLLGPADVSTTEGLLAAFEERETLAAALAALDASGEVDSEGTVSASGAEAPRHVRIYAEMAQTGSSRRIVGILQDVTARKHAIRELEWLATHDALTGVCNRAIFTRRVEAAMRRTEASGPRAGLILLDVDRFKAINDTLGHDAGDRVLVSVAERLVATVGHRGIVARLGGDEFGILLDPVATDGAAIAVATDILAALRRPARFEGFELGTRATLGIALSTRDQGSATALFKEADIALYEAKRAGRDRYALFRPEMRVTSEIRRSVLTAAQLAATG